jgi:hypothetical protein
MFGMDASTLVTPVVQESLKGLAEDLGVKYNELIAMIKPKNEEFDFIIEIHKIETLADGRKKLTFVKDMDIKEFIGS